MSAGPLPDECGYDAERDTFTLYGIEYTGVLFRSLALTNPGTWMRVEERRDGQITIFQPSEETGELLDAIVGKGVTAR